MNENSLNSEYFGSQLFVKGMKILVISIAIFIGVNLFVHSCDGYNHNREKILTSRVIGIKDVRLFTVILQNGLDTYNLIGTSKSFRLTVQIGDSVIKAEVSDYCILVHAGIRRRIRMIGPNPICGKED